MSSEDCDPASPLTSAPNTHVIQRDTRSRRVALTGCAIATATCVALFALHLLRVLPLGRPGTAMWCSWLLALASVAWRISYLRVPAAQMADDFADRYAFGDAASLPLGDPVLDPLLAGIGSQCVFSRPSTWSLLGMAGGLCWGGAVTLTAMDATGHIHAAPTDLLIGLGLLFWGAVHFTCTAVTAPTIYRQRAIRQAGALAHQRMRMLRDGQAPHDTVPHRGALHIVESQSPDGRAHRAAQ